jgi:hypothetical protein
VGADGEPVDVADVAEQSGGAGRADAAQVEQPATDLLGARAVPM